MAMDSAGGSRSLWQVPVFLLGAAALVAVWYGRPYWQQTPAQRYERDLASLRGALDKNPVDPVQVQTLLRKVQGVEAPPQLAKQAPYIIGSAVLVQAESLAAPDEVVEQWKLARKLLEQANDAGVPDVDKPRLQYRLARAWARTGEPTRKVLDAIQATQKCGDDPSEGNYILHELYMKLDPPEVAKARDALKEYVAKALPARNDAQQWKVSQARLHLGELHLQLGEPEDARKVLERIGPDSTPEILVAARILLARSFLAEEDWNAAIRCLEQARDVRGVTPGQKTFILYNLAEAYQRSHRKNEAVAALQQLRKTGGQEAQAAALRLVELVMTNQAKRDEAVEVLESFAAEVPAADSYDNKLFPLKDARNVFEEAAQMMRTAGAFDLSLRVARAYGKLADGGRDHELAAEALQTWGQLMLDQAAVAEPEDRPRLVDDGTKKIREAAKSWQSAAAAKKVSLEKGDPLYRSAELYLRAGDQEEALKALDEIGLKVPDYPQDRLADVWLKKGEVYLALGNRDQARLCFQNGIQAAEAHPSPSLLRCRIRLGEILLKGNDTAALARLAAELEVNFGSPELTRDREVHEAGMSFLADMLFQQKDYRKAEVRYRSLLDNYPDSARALQSRFQLGQCYWFIAGQEADKCKTAKKVIDDSTVPEDRKKEAENQYETSYKLYMDWLRKAAEPFRAVETTLLKGTSNPKLAPAEAELLRKASFYAADCAFFAGEYEDCVLRFDAIAQRYAGTVAQLEALRTVWRCYQYYMQKGDKAVETLTQIRTAYVQMPESEFDDSTEIRRRDHWQKWFDQVMPGKN